MSSTDLARPAAMPDVLAAVAGELSLAMGQCARLDAALGQLLDDATVERRTAVLQELHRVDLLHQQIAAMVGFVVRLSDAAGRQPAVDVGPALDAITLGEVADRIRHGVGHAAAPTLVGASDEVDLF
jgi:hypothetical protein